MNKKTIKYKYKMEMQTLHIFVLDFLAEASIFKLQENINLKNIVVPFEERLYMGSIQSMAYRVLQQGKKTENRTFLMIFEANDSYLGDIYNDKNTIYLPQETSSSTVLGQKIPIDNDIIDLIQKKLKHTNIIKKNGLFDYREEIFSQLPFLRVLFENFKIVPIILGNIGQGNSFEEIVDLLGSDSEISKTIPIFITKWSKSRTEHTYIEDYKKSLKRIQDGVLQIDDLFFNTNIINIYTKLNLKQKNNLININLRTDKEIIGPDEYAEVFGSFGFM